ncbi:MAG: type II secretion system protein GspM [Gammaproteobacteria bacterium]
MDWFNQREPRERLILLVGAFLVVAIVGWKFIWEPLRIGTSELDASVEQRAREVIDLKRAAGLAASGVATATPGDNPSLLVLIDETARPLGLATTFTRSNQDGPDVVNVNFRDARFDRLLTWLVTLEQQYGLAVATASISRANGSGLVSGQVRLDRS